MASLKIIASEVGVSYTLVSKVLSGRLGTTGVSERTRELIVRKARELDYKANPLAVALKSGRKGVVGIFLHRVGTPGSDISDRLLRGLTNGLEQSGLRMWMRYFETDEEFFEACDRKLQREVDGLIVGGEHRPKLFSRLKEIDQQGLPVVSVFFDRLDPTHNTVPLGSHVSVDSELQGYLATAHLLDRGSRKLAHLSMMPSRGHGFRRAHAERGFAVDPRLFLKDVGYLYSDGEHAVRQLHAAGASFDGVVCQSDAQALGVINELNRRGVRVPEQVRVTGMDNSPLADVCIVPVTSVTAGVRNTGLKAAELLLERIEGGQHRAVTIEPELIVRRSSGG